MVSPITPTGSANGRVMAALAGAAQRTGVDFSYLLANARAESGLDPMARASTSSASGLFQFTDATWLAMVERHGDAHGLGWAADALRQGASGAVRATILNLRHNAEAAAAMAGEFTRENAARLEQGLGRAAGAADLYLAAFFGAGGAIRFLKSMALAPDAAAAGLLPQAAAANRSTFFAQDGRPRSLAEVHRIVSDRIGRHLGVEEPGPAVASPAIATVERMTADPALAAARARMAYLVLAALQ